MEILCTRPGCTSPRNHFDDLDDPTRLKTTQQKYCTSCGMHLILGGRYVTEKLLGQGGFGAAFLASDRYTPTMRKCVVKQFQPIGNLDDEQLALAQGLFEREAHVLERIGDRHKQIPDLFAFFPLIVPDAQGSGNNQYFYLVQEYIEGEDFEEILKRESKLPESTVTEILISMLGVLDFVHNEDTIHRDIKPSNIMKRVDGKLYLLDFGAVKEVAVGAGSGTPSQRSTGIYSPGYAPPEQMRGAQVFPATDLYALAVTCIVLLTGEPPEDLFDGYTNAWQWRKFTKVSDKLGKVLDHMLETAPGDRPKSAKEALTALQAQPQQQLKTQPPKPRTPAPAKGTQIQAPPPSAPKKTKRKAGSASTHISSPPVAVQPASTTSSASLVSQIVGAAFVGFEGTLVYFIANNFLSAGLGMGAWGAVMGGLIFLILRKQIETTEILIFGVISTALAVFFGGSIPVTTMLAIAVFAGAGVVAIFILFTIIYRLLQKVL
ncbi:MAG: protein kinase [Limnothrix sp.]